MPKLPLLLLAALPFLPSCYMARAYKFRNLNLRSHEDMPSVPMNNNGARFSFIKSPQPDTILKTRLDKELQGSGTAAFLVIRNDSILYENYFDGFSQQSLLPSFSVAKSFVATLIGMALEEGKISSLNDPLTNYLPRFLKKDERFARITIQHLLDMRSGLVWNEGSYGLKDDAIKMAFRPNMMPHVYKVKIKEAPGKMDYQSINTLLLAMVLEKATGMKPVAYLRQKLWEPLGMEYAATWTTDKRKHELAYAGINATARDFAKFGRLYLNKGNWNGKQLLSDNWVSNTTSPAAMHASEGYKNQFWGSGAYTEFEDSTTAVKALGTTSFHSGRVQSYRTANGTKRFFVSYTGTSFYALGILGQYIHVNPANNSIIVRLGYHWSHPNMQLGRFIAAESNRL